MKGSDDILTSYYYFCAFDASLNNGAITTIEAALPYTVEDQFRVGETLTMRYAPEDPRICALVAAGFARTPSGLRLRG